VSAEPIQLLEEGLNVSGLVDWITLIDFEDWPQQHRIDHQLRPAMVNDLEWNRFGIETDDLVQDLMLRHFTNAEAFNRMLSVVMPHHWVGRHTDAQQPNWLHRVHVPLATNNASFMFVGELQHNLSVGSAYLIDTTVAHAVSNNGETPRIHFMFDVKSR
jgi:aspartyl/asparaginyl beta-hydroxylase (cupin superfamily)